MEETLLAANFQLDVELWFTEVVLFLWFCNDDDDGDNDDNDGDDDDPSCYIIFVIDYVHDRLGMSQHSRVDILCLIIIL